MKLWKYSGLLLVITGILHIIVAILLRGDVYWDMIQDGLIASTKDVTRGFALWFFVCGVLIILFGQTLHYYIRREQKPAPLFLGYALLVFSVLGGLIEPVSGFWLFIPQALIIIMADGGAKVILYFFVC